MSTTEQIKVSVIMPIYNAYDYLRPAMDSVIDQTLKEIEIVCIDDGSTDHSLEIIKEYQKADSRIRIIPENNAGPSIARNKGLARCRGEYVIFLDADDFYEPTLLEKLYERAVKDNLDLTIAKFDIYNSRKAFFEPAIDSDHHAILEEGRVVSKNEYPDQILQCATGYVWNKLYKKAFLAEKELTFLPEIRVFEDVYFVSTTLASADRIGRVDEILVHHRVYSAQSKNKLFKKYYEQVPVLYTRIKSHLMSRGTFLPLSQSFLNLSASRCYKIYNVLWNDAKEKFWNMLHNAYAEELGWTADDIGEIEDEAVHDFVANILDFSHEQYLNRVATGQTARVGGVKRAAKQYKKRKRIRDFFKALLFRKNKKSDTL